MLNVTGIVDYLETTLKEIEEAQDGLDEEGVDLDLLASLEERLSYLHHYADARREDANPIEVKIDLGYDFVQWSFSIVAWVRPLGSDEEWQYWWTGGLIFHSPGIESFSVDISGQSGPRWMIHT